MLDSSTLGSSMLLPIVATPGIRQVEGITRFQQRIHSPDTTFYTRRQSTPPSHNILGHRAWAESWTKSSRNALYNMKHHTWLFST